jgi:phage tail-like protein
MAQFSANTRRPDPYGDFNGGVGREGRYMAGVGRVSGIKRMTEVINHRSGGDPSTSSEARGYVKYEPVTLERGVTDDREFAQWANKTSNHGPGRGPGGEASRADVGKDIAIALPNESSDVVLGHRVFRAQVSGFVALPEMDVNAVAIAKARVGHERWERERVVVAWAGPDFLEP